MATWAQLKMRLIILWQERLFWVMFISWFIMYISWYIFAIFTGFNMIEVHRELALKGAKLFTVIPALIITINIGDKLTPGDWLSKIGESSDACAKVTIALMLAAAYCVA